MKKWYAVYKGDKFLTQGYKEDIAKYLEIQVRSVDFYTSPTYKRRKKDSKNAIILVEVKD